MNYIFEGEDLSFVYYSDQFVLIYRHLTLFMVTLRYESLR
jgi:hypothetical protein